MMYFNARHEPDMRNYYTGKTIGSFIAIGTIAYAIYIR
jgi:hypothetical protein